MRCLLSRPLLLLAQGTFVSIALVPSGAGGAAATGVPAGQVVYQKHCAACHDQSSPRIPPRAALEKLSATRILRTLDFGLMMIVAYPLRRDERVAVATYLGTAANDPPLPRSAFCGRAAPHFSDAPAPSWPGWSPTLTNDRFQPAPDAGLSAADIPRLKLKWAFGYRGDVSAFAAPTVQNGILYVGSASGTVHALDAKSGCLYWTFDADGPVRAAPLIHQAGSLHLLLFGDLTGSFYALDATNGRLLWKRRVEEHESTRLTGSAATSGDLVYVPVASWEENRAISAEYPCCTFRGSVTALHIGDGSVAWKRYLVDPPQQTGGAPNGTPRLGPSGAGVWSAPTVDPKRGVLYVGTGDNYSAPATSTSDAVVALDLRSGRIVWSQQTIANDAWNRGCMGSSNHCPGVQGPDYDYGSSPILVRSAGHDLLVAGQKSGTVYAFDPDSQGKILWKTSVGTGGINGGVQWGMAADEGQIYAAVNDAVRLRDNSNGAGAVLDVANFEPAQGGGLTALSLIDGRKIWHAPSHPCAPPRPGCNPGQPAAVTAIRGVVFSGSTDGHLRAFSTDDGRVLWDVDTARDYKTVDGVAARGGSLDGPGPVIVAGMLYVNSGYSRLGGAAGNVLLAFSVDGQ
jgi:polyvinyl alcohol dehydrogenase (cytochrome)